jgi:peptide/nickel transport system ATP-binding protein
MTAPAPLLEVEDLVVEFGRRRGGVTRVINGVSFAVAQGETVALVGESGSGKTTIGRAILGLTPVAGGTIRYDGEIAHSSASTRSTMRAHGTQVVFQDPYSSLNPSRTIEAALMEPVRAAGNEASRAYASHLLEQVGLPGSAVTRYPHEFSGGQRQRIAIARALSVKPKLIVCDEPTSALDASTQARVLDLLQSLQRETGVAYLFISHDLAVVRQVSDRIAVLYRGEIVELGTAEQVTDSPRHDYTRRLQLSTPVPDPTAQRLRREQRRTLLAAQGKSPIDG